MLRTDRRREGMSLEGSMSTIPAVSQEAYILRDWAHSTFQNLPVQDGWYPEIERNRVSPIEGEFPPCGQLSCNGLITQCNIFLGGCQPG